MSGDRHARCRRCDGAVVVEDRQQQRLQHRAFGEGADDGQERGTGEIALALRVADDVAGEAEVLEVVEGVIGDDRVRVQPVDLLGLELEALHRLEDAADSRDDAESAGGGQPASEDFEGRGPECGSGFEGGVEHREFVHVRQQ